MLKRNCEVLLWLTEKEQAELKANAKKCSLSVQAYLRQLLSGIQLKERPPEDFSEVLSRLRWIGNNLRQIAIKANTLGLIDAEQYWQNVEQLNQVVSDLKDYMIRG